MKADHIRAESNCLKLITASPSTQYTHCDSEGTLLLKTSQTVNCLLLTPGLTQSSALPNHQVTIGDQAAISQASAFFNHQTPNWRATSLGYKKPLDHSQATASQASAFFNYQATDWGFSPSGYENTSICGQVISSHASAFSNYTISKLAPMHANYQNPLVNSAAVNMHAKGLTDGPAMGSADSSMMQLLLNNTISLRPDSNLLNTSALEEQSDLTCWYDIVFLITQQVIEVVFKKWQSLSISFNRNSERSLYYYVGTRLSILSDVIARSNMSLLRMIWRIFSLLIVIEATFVYHRISKFVPILNEKLSTSATFLFSSEEYKSRILTHWSINSWTAKANIIAQPQVIVNAQQTFSIDLEHWAYESEMNTSKLTSLLSSCSQWSVHICYDHHDWSQAYHYVSSTVWVKDDETSWRESSATDWFRFASQELYSLIAEQCSHECTLKKNESIWTFSKQTNHKETSGSQWFAVYYVSWKARKYNNETHSQSHQMYEPCRNLPL